MSPPAVQWLQDGGKGRREGHAQAGDWAGTGAWALCCAERVRSHTDSRSLQMGRQSSGQKRKKLAGLFLDPGQAVLEPQGPGAPGPGSPGPRWVSTSDSQRADLEVIPAALVQS